MKAAWATSRSSSGPGTALARTCGLPWGPTGMLARTARLHVGGEGTGLGRSEGRGRRLGARERVGGGRRRCWAGRGAHLDRLAGRCGASFGWKAAASMVAC